MMESKFYIYARGRWCELDTRSGRVEGWKERARFLYFKGGKLELLRTARVLRGLRALVAGAPGAVRDGPPLPQRRRRQRRRSRRARDSRRSHHHCCVHHRCDVNANALLGKSVLPSPAPPAPLPPPPHTPRRRRIIRSDEESPQDNADKSPAKKETPRSTRNIPALQSVASNTEERKRVTRSAIKLGKHTSVVLDTDSSKEEEKIPKTRTRKQDVVSISDDSQDKPSEKVVENNRKTSLVDAQQILLGLSDSEDSGRQSDDSEPAKELVIDEEDVVVLRRFLARRGIGNLDRFDNDEDYKRRLFYKLNPLVTLQRCRPLENLLRQRMTLKEFARNLGLRSVAEVTPEKRYRMRASTKLARAATDSETDKENVAKPKRRKLWNNDKELFNSVSSRASEGKPRPQPAPQPAAAADGSGDTSDSDTEFRRRVRARLARSSTRRAAAAGRQHDAARDQRATRSSMKGPAPLKEQNNPSDGTRSAPTAARAGGARRPPAPRRRPPASSDSAFDTAATPRRPPGMDKGPKVDENIPILRSKNREGKDVIVERVERLRPAAARPGAAGPAPPARGAPGKPVAFRASSVAGGREYTSLEDHAIVAWVSAGGRERRVNGNALWRELQDHYTAITGQERTWHSLRNRYLRYLLPALGRLALPPAQASRLRAAAAAGVMKVLQRRNSIFDAPAAPSASRRAAPPAAPAAAPAAAAPAAAATDRAAASSPRSPRPPRSPRRAPPSPTYSAVTRRFRTRTSAPHSPSPASASARTLRRKAKKW